MSSAAGVKAVAFTGSGTGTGAVGGSGTDDCAASSVGVVLGDLPGVPASRDTPGAPGVASMEQAWRPLAQSGTSHKERWSRASGQPIQFATLFPSLSPLSLVRLASDDQ